MKAGLSAALTSAVLLTLSAGDARAEEGARFQFAFPASQFRVTVKAENTTVILEVGRDQRRRRRREMTAYVSRGVAAGGVRANLPGIGRIAMRFHPLGRWQPILKCFGSRSLEKRAGVFVGTFHFVGENRYLVANRRRATGYETMVHGNCSAPAGQHRPRRLSAPENMRLVLPSTEPTPGKRDPGTEVQAGFRKGPLARSFKADKRPGHRLELEALEEDVRGGLGTFRVLSTLAPRASLTVDRRLSAARVKGAPPFAGSATLSRAANGSRIWTGDLTASFLGDPGVPMTGPEYKTRLSRGF